MTPRRPLRVNNVTITEATILATRQHFADIADRCIAGALDGSMYVNDVKGYVARQQRNSERMMAGDWDHSYTFMQRALWLQTGECEALLRDWT